MVPKRPASAPLLTDPALVFGLPVEGSETTEASPELPLPVASPAATVVVVFVAVVASPAATVVAVVVALPAATVVAVVVAVVAAVVVVTAVSLTLALARPVISVPRLSLAFTVTVSVCWAPAPPMKFPENWQEYTLPGPPLAWRTVPTAALHVVPRDVGRLP